MSDQIEQIAVFPYRYMPFVFTGYIPLDNAGTRVHAFSRFMDMDRQAIDLRFVPRHKKVIEKDPEQKQLVVYCIVTSQEPGETEMRYYSYSRGKAGDESRLHAKRSIGIGGHVEVNDDVLLSERPISSLPYLTALTRVAALREIVEELRIPKSHALGSNLYVSGFVNNDDEDVGCVHLGIVYSAHIPRSVASPAPEIADPEWKTADELFADIGRYETWSQFIIRHIANVRYSGTRRPSPEPQPA